MRSMMRSNSAELITVAVVVPPLGVIYPTVLTAFGEILTFAGAIVGLDYSYKAKNKKE